MNRWDDKLWLFTPEEYCKLPDGIVLTSINGTTYIKGIDYIDMDVRFGHIAFGIESPTTHPEKELFAIFMLTQT